MYVMNTIHCGARHIIVVLATHLLDKDANLTIQEVKKKICCITNHCSVQTLLGRKSLLSAVIVRGSQS